MHLDHGFLNLLRWKFSDILEPSFTKVCRKRND